MKHLICITLGDEKNFPTKAIIEYTKLSIKEQLKDYPDLIPLIVLKEVSKIQVEALYDKYLR